MIDYEARAWLPILLRLLACKDMHVELRSGAV
jgi:hypothetical protein